MRIRRIFESIEFGDIEDLIIDFEDRTDFSFEIKGSGNFINLIGAVNKPKFNKMEFINELIILVERMGSLGYENIDEGNVISLLPGKFEVQLQFTYEY